MFELKIVRGGVKEIQSEILTARTVGSTAELRSRRAGGGLLVLWGVRSTTVAASLATLLGFFKTLEMGIHIFFHLLTV